MERFTATNILNKKCPFLGLIALGMKEFARCSMITAYEEEFVAVQYNRFSSDSLSGRCSRAASYHYTGRSYEAVGS